MENNTMQQHPKQKTLYEAGYSEIFLKNFLAGFGRALGGLFVNLILFVITGYMFIAYVLPQFEPLITGMAHFSKSVESISGAKKDIGSSLKNLLGK